jgi:hypothetical protein
LNSETPQLIHQAYGDNAMRQAVVLKWWKHFGDGEMNVKGQNCLFHYLPEACVVRSTSLAMGGTSKKRPSLHLHKILTQNNMVSL